MSPPLTSSADIGVGSGTSSGSIRRWQTGGHYAIIRVAAWFSWRGVAREKLRRFVTKHDSTGLEMQQDKIEERALDKQLDEICECFRAAVDSEVKTLQREGLPIYVAENGSVVDLQHQDPRQ